MPDPAPSSVDFGFLVGLEPKDAVAYLREKKFRISDGDWRQVWQEANDTAFTVARMTRYRLLAQTRQIVDDMLAQGKTAKEAAGEMESAFRDAGWWGKRVITDSAGQAQMVQLGSPWRIRTIINTNAHTAYNAGWNHRQLELAPERPYWRYTAVLDGSTRQSHRELDGQIFDAEAPVWRTIYPPNGFNCRCRVRALSRQQMERSGLAANRDGAVTDIEDVDDYGVITPRRRASWVDAGGKKRDFTPDPGWSYNPGRESFAWSDPPSGARAKTGQRTWKDYGLADACDMPRSPTPAELPRAGSRFAAISAVEEALGLSDATPSCLLRTPVGTVLLDQRLVHHVTEKFGDHRERYASRILPTLENPDEVWVTEYDNGKSRTRYMKFFQARKTVLLIVEETEMGVGPFHNLIPKRVAELNRSREGNLIYPTRTEGS